MAVTGSDFEWRLPANKAVDFTTTAIGGAVTTDVIANNSLGNIFFAMTSGESGEGDTDQHQKIFLHLKSTASGNFTAPKVYLPNALEDLGANSKLRGTCEGGETAGTKKLRAIGENSSGTPTQEEKTMPSSAGDLDWTTDWARLDRVTCLVVSTGADTTVTDPVVFKTEPTASPGSGYSEIGEIPSGMQCATGEVTLWPEASLNTSTTNGTGNDCTVAPAGSSFSKPWDPADGVSLPTPMTPGDSAPIWLRWRLPEEALGAPEIQVRVRVKGGV